jgi:hypothetical protein
MKREKDKEHRTDPDTDIPAPLKPVSFCCMPGCTPYRRSEETPEAACCREKAAASTGEASST